MERLGIYGGTFSPPHNGHIHAAKVFLREMALDRLLVVPTSIPPHKARTEETSAQARLAMCRLAFSFSESIEVSDMEIRRQGFSYTSDTLRELTQKNRQLFFLCGTDMLLTLDCWHEPETIFALADIVCMARENDGTVRAALEEKAKFYRKKYSARVHLLSSSAVEQSSSDVRAAMKKGNAWEDMLAPSVVSFIKREGLYR